MASSSILQNVQNPDQQIQNLIEEAKEAQKFSYCRYSNFPVGCALLCSDGTVVRGANVENASYGNTICAERTAYVSAVSSGKKTFKAAAVVTNLPEPAFPCGLCRQFMVEFGNVDVYSHSTISNKTTLVKLHDLLPMHFGPNDLDQNEECIKNGLKS